MKKNFYNQVTSENQSELACFVLDKIYNPKEFPFNPKLFYLFADFFTKRKDVIGYYMMAECYKYGYYVKCDYKKAYKLYKKAENNVAFALPEIGYLCMKGLGIKKDYDKAIIYFQSSICPPYPEPRGYLYLGHYYYKDGRKSELNKKKALSYYKKALRDGDYKTRIEAKKYIKVLERKAK